MKIQGKDWNYGDDVNTDVIFAGKYTYTIKDRAEMAKVALEDLDPEFTKNAQPGDIIVGGENFGCGSSREHAPLAIKGAGVSCVIAESFARIFYRNSFNMGLLLMEVGDDVDKINDGDELEIDAATGIIRDLTNGAQITCPPLP